MSESGQVWVSAHTRNGVTIEGHFRQQPAPAGPSGNDAPVAGHEAPAHQETDRSVLDEMVHPPLTDAPGSGWVSSAWLAAEALDDPVVTDQLRRVFASQRDLTRLDELGLAHSPVASVTSLYEDTTNDVRVVRFQSGQVGYHKPYTGLDDEMAYEFGQTSAQQPVHEVAAWRLARTLGPPYNNMVAPTVMRSVDNRIGSVSQEMTGSPKPPFLPPATAMDPDAWRAAAFYDSLIGQQDRHFGNARYRPDGGLSLIDHGFAFARPGDFHHCSVFQRMTTEGDPSLRDHERQALHRLHADTSLGGAAAILEPDRVHALRSRIEMMLNTDRLMPTNR